ncbi:acyl-CoA dehydrogenase family protein [Modestobacter sp. NPDC049651]|uniref:acyl-CoA dehydrogenase family protein n=1 Tax=unclassified Modestobacter TaxID=2643866 RepID=UPI0033F122C4
MSTPAATLSELLRDRVPAGTWDADLWAALTAAGLTGTGLPVEAGGSGGSAADAAAVVRTGAAAGVAGPLAEQLLVAGPALLAADVVLPPAGEPLTVALAPTVHAEPLDDGDGPGRYRLSGTAPGVPWAEVAAHVAVLAAPPPGIDGAVLALAAAPSTDPDGAVHFPGTSVPGVLLAPAQADEVRARLRLARAVQVSGVLADPELTRLVDAALDGDADAARAAVPRAASAAADDDRLAAWRADLG